MPRRVRVSNHGEIQPDEWVPTHAVKFNEDGTVDLMTEPAAALANRRRRNAAAPGTRLYYHGESGGLAMYGDPVTVLKSIPAMSWIGGNKLLYDALEVEGPEGERYYAPETWFSEKEPRAYNRGGRRRNARAVPFSEGNESVMVIRRGYPVWIESQRPVSSDRLEWEGVVSNMTHPDYEFGQPIFFTADEVRDTE